MKETQFIDDKVLRDKSVEHYEVLMCSSIRNRVIVINC